IPREYTGRKVSATDRLQGPILTVVLAQDNDGHKTTTTTSRSASRKHLIRVGSSFSALIESDTVLSIKIHRDEKSGKILKLIRASSSFSGLIESGTVLSIKIHRDEESGKILNLVFVWADEGSELKVDVPVVSNEKMFVLVSRKEVL
ncbi:hypothetical protein HYC85_027346, partial [Camellia sinensis]